MGSHGYVRTLVGRLAALMLMALLVVPGAAPLPTTEPGTFSMPEAGMNPVPQPVPSVSAALPLAPATLAAAIATPLRVVLAAPRADRTPRVRTLGPKAARLGAPSILRI